jgi:tRNA pseudouridine55 synthase
MFGILSIHKPSGITSREAVDCVGRLVRPDRAGHAGTLDPLADGVLVVCVGSATRLIEYVQRMPKQYCGTFLLGRTSPTEDIEGEVTPVAGATVPTLDSLRQAATQWVGEVEQRPPAYSALKIKGRRAYTLARQGRDVALASRPVTVYAIDIVEYDYPRLVLDVRCGGGTYIRSLGRDVARAAGTGAVMSALTRTAIGDFHLSDACPLDALTRASIGRWMQSPRAAVSQLPQLELSPEEIETLSHGRVIAARNAPDADRIAAVDKDGNLRAIVAPEGDRQLRPVRNFPRA